MNRQQITTRWVEWMKTEDGKRCWDFSTLEDPGDSPENRLRWRLWLAFLGGGDSVLAHQATTLHEGLDITGNIPSEVYVGIGRDHYETQYEVAEDVGAILGHQIERLKQRPREIHEKTMWQINAHGGLPSGIHEHRYPIEQLVGEVLTARDDEIDRLRVLVEHFRPKKPDVMCPVCRGSGRKGELCIPGPNPPCDACGGIGRVWSQQAVEATEVSTLSDYHPDVAIPPGATIQEWLDTTGMTRADLAKKLDLNVVYLNGIIQGERAIGRYTAAALAQVLPCPADFWLNLEKNYRLALDRQKEAAPGDTESTFKVLKSLPDDSIRVVRPIPIVVQPGGGMHMMASLRDASISASGKTPEEAVGNLGDIVAAKFRLFSQKENILGEQPRRQLHVLRQYLQGIRSAQDVAKTEFDS